MTNLERERQQFIADQVRYDRMSELSRTLHIPIIYPIWRLKVGKAGAYHTEREFYANSWTRNAYNIISDQSMGGLSNGQVLIGSTYGDGSLARKKLNGGINITSFAFSGTAAGVYAAAVGADDDGIIIGTGTQPESLNDFELDALIVEGTMDYQACVLDSSGWNAGSLFMFSIWTRDIDNNSGGAITVSELGMINDADFDDLLVVRDLLSSSQEVLDTETLTVELEFRQPYPS